MREKMDTTLIVNGMKSLWNGLKYNTWPDVFFSELLGISDEIIERLPRFLFYYIVVYGVAAIISLIFHYSRGQKSFSDLGRKMVDVLCWTLVVMCGWLIPQFIAQGKLMASAVEGEFAFTADGWHWLSEYLQAWFDPIWLGALFVAIAIMPLLTVRRYIKVYKLSGIPWAIFDEGFALFCMSIAVQAMYSGNPLWYIGVVIAFVLILLGQSGGVDLE